VNKWIPAFAGTTTGVMRLRISRIYVRRGDVLAIILAIVLISGLGVLASLGRWNLPWTLLGNFGFGSDWRCIWPSEGEPLCIKQPAEAVANPR
jgi:hypothetical protein